MQSSKLKKLRRKEQHKSQGIKKELVHVSRFLEMQKKIKDKIKKKRKEMESQNN